MTSVVDVPDEYAETHRLVWDYRNRAVAHSQSDLTSTYAVASHWDRFEGGLDVQAVTMDELIGPIRDRLAAEARQMRDAGVGADQMRQALVARPTSEFSARTNRSPFPVGTAIYVELAD